MVEPVYCRICGERITSDGVMFGAAGRPMFAAHNGACADKVRAGAGILGQALRGLLRQKAPRASQALDTVVELAQQMKSPQQEH